MISVVARDGGLFGGCNIECMEFTMADNRNGDIADQPPNGHASKTALEHAPMLIAKCIGDLMEYDLTTVSVMCGQGLIDHTELIREKLGQGFGDFCPPLGGLRVYRASATYASEEAGIPMQMSDEAMEAMMAL